METREKMMTVKEVAEMLGISESLVYQLRAEGQIKARRFGGKGRRGCIRFVMSDVQSYVDGCTAELDD